MHCRHSTYQNYVQIFCFDVDTGYITNINKHHPEHPAFTTAIVHLIIFDQTQTTPQEMFIWNAWLWISKHIWKIWNHIWNQPCTGQGCEDRTSRSMPFHHLSASQELWICVVLNTYKIAWQRSSFFDGKIGYPLRS